MDMTIELSYMTQKAMRSAKWIVAKKIRYLTTPDFLELMVTDCMYPIAILIQSMIEMSRHLYLLLPLKMLSMAF